MEMVLTLYYFVVFQKMNSIGRDLLSYCSLHYEEHFFQSMSDRMDMWHLMDMTRYGKDRAFTQSKLIAIFQYVKEKSRFWFGIPHFRWMMSQDSLRSWLPFFLEQIPMIHESDLFWICRTLLYQNKNDDSVSLLQALNTRCPILSLLWNPPRRETIHVEFITHPTILSFLKNQMEEHVHDEMPLFLHLLWIILSFHDIRHETLRTSVDRCMESMELCNYLLSKQRIHEILWLSERYDLSFQKILLERASRMETSESFFQLLDHWKVPIQSLNLQETKHPDILYTFVSALNQQDQYEPVWLDVMDIYEAWTPCLYDCHVEWFHPLWNTHHESILRSLENIHIYRYLHSVVSVSMTQELFWNLLHYTIYKDVHYSRKDLIEELIDRHPSFQPSFQYFLEHSQFMFQLEHWTISDYEFLWIQWPIPTSFVQSLFSFYIDIQRVDMVQWLYTICQDKYQCITEMLQSNHPEMIEWSIHQFQKDGFVKETLLSILDQVMIQSCKKGFSKVIPMIGDLFPERYILRFHKRYLCPRAILVESFHVKINLFVSEMFSREMLSESECVICYQPSTIWMTNCRHILCRTCLETWFQTSTQFHCPMCRSFVHRCQRISE